MRARVATTCSLVATLALGSLGVVALLGPTAGAGADQPQAPSHALTVEQVLSGATLHHRFTPVGTAVTATEPLADPDDISQLGDTLFVGFQNGVGPQGQPSASGDQDSTVVQLTLTGRVLGQWDIQGKADGVTADPAFGGAIATVNEDADSALYVIRPGHGAATRYAYDETLPHGGGTDAITVYDGRILISASAPGTTGAAAPQPDYPAVYSVVLHPNSDVAAVTPLFFDEDTATVANVGSQLGHSTQLALTDPDSNERVPFQAPRFGGSFMLTSQGDLQQIFVSGVGTARQHLSVLDLTQSVDDTAWAVGPGALYTTDSTDDTVDVVTGPFPGDEPIVAATPCGSNSAPGVCPGPGYPANYLGALNPWTGQVRTLSLRGVPYTPQGGLAWVSTPSW